MESAKNIQQLLRPTDTCIFISSLCVPLCWLVRSTGVEAKRVSTSVLVLLNGATRRIALFLFEVTGTKPSLQISLDHIFHIRGSFKTNVQENRGGKCKLLVNTDEGLPILLELPSESSSQFIKQLNTCLSLYVLSQSKSTNAFQWLRGYNGCRTGWDRFSKPTMTDRPPFGKAGVGGSQSSQTTALPVPQFSGLHGRRCPVLRHAALHIGLQSARAEEEAQMTWMRSSNAGSEAHLTSIGDFANDCFNMFDFEDIPTPPPSIATAPPPTAPEPANPFSGFLWTQNRDTTTGDRGQAPTGQGSDGRLLPVATEVEDPPSIPSMGRRPGSVTRRPHKDKGAYVSRYRPGVPVLKGPYRDSIIQVELQKREGDFCQWNRLRLFCGTWNVNGQPAPSHLDEFLLDYTAELDLSAQCLISNESNRERWKESIEVSLKKKGNFYKVCSVRLVGIFLLVYIKKELAKHISDVVAECVETGMHGLMGNKGGVGIRFNYHHSSFCFVNCHLAAHTEQVEKRIRFTWESHRSIPRSESS
eukprot:Em0023g393a